MQVVDHLDDVVKAVGRDRLWSFSAPRHAAFTPRRPLPPATVSSSARKAAAYPLGG